MTDREKFEAWCINQCTYSLEYFDATKKYKFNKTRQAWKIWQAALASKQPADDGWIEWAGGECPAQSCEIVDVRWRAGGTMTVIAGEHIWTHDGTFDDIIAYRVVKP